MKSPRDGSHKEVRPLRDRPVFSLSAPAIGDDDALLLVLLERVQR